MVQIPRFVTICISILYRWVTCLLCHKAYVFHIENFLRWLCIVRFSFVFGDGFSIGVLASLHSSFPFRLYPYGCKSDASPVFGCANCACSRLHPLKYQGSLDTHSWLHPGYTLTPWIRLRIHPWYTFKVPLNVVGTTDLNDIDKTTTMVLQLLPMPCGRRNPRDK